MTQRYLTNRKYSILIGIFGLSTVPKSGWTTTISDTHWYLVAGGYVVLLFSVSSMPTTYILYQRICPGMHLANNSLVSLFRQAVIPSGLWRTFQMLNTMNLIWAFNFDQAVDTITKLPIAVDTFDYQRVRAIYIIWPPNTYTPVPVGNIDQPTTVQVSNHPAQPGKGWVGWAGVHERFGHIFEVQWTNIIG